MNEPLTLEQLKSKSDEPVYVKLIGKTNSILHDGWAFLDYCLYDTEFVTIWWPGSDVQDFGFFEDYGKTWLAYAYPPAHIDREAWTAEWLNFYGDYSTAECSNCGELFEVSDTEENLPVLFNAFKKYYKFCPSCGRAMTDEAVDMVMERLEALHENRD